MRKEVKTSRDITVRDNVLKNVYLPAFFENGLTIMMTAKISLGEIHSIKV